MEYRQNRSTDRKRALALLAGRFSLLAHKARRVERVWLDTFDWRLTAQAMTMEETTEGGATRTEWKDAQSGAILGRIAGRAPAFADGWPEGPLAERLRQAIKVRALLPLAKARETIREVEARDRRGKVVARLSFEKAEIPANGKSRPAQVFHTIRLFPLKGFAEEAAIIRQTLEAELSLPPAPPLHETVFAASGLSPLSYSSKIGVRLDPETQAAEALRSIFKRLAETMEQNLAGTTAATDTEFLHDFRVAVRRTRSALGQMKSAIAPGVLSRFRPAFGKLGLLTGPTRDLDVYLLKLDSYSSGLPEDSVEALKPLKAWLLSRQKEERAKLAKYLKSSAYSDFFAKWTKALEKPWKSRAEGWSGKAEVREVAGRRIHKIYKRVVKQGAMLTPDSPPAAVHRLRIDCKKLRYMIEFFRSVFPAQEVDSLVARLKELQDTLGDFQDHEVHRLELYGYAEAMAAKNLAPPRTLVAMGELAESLAERQRAARAGIAGRFETFGSPETRRKFRAVFAPRRESDGEGDGDL